MRTPPRDDFRFSNTTGIPQKKKKTMWFIGVKVEQETSAPPRKKILDPPLVNVFRHFKFICTLYGHESCCIGRILFIKLNWVFKKINPFCT